MRVDAAVVFRNSTRRYCLTKAREVVKHIREDGHCPIDTGDLINGYRAVAVGNGASVVTDIEYWKYVEFGTRYQHPQPHVRPAYEEVAKHSKASSFGHTFQGDA
jgi:HK97 gp10 family phage protein